MSIQPEMPEENLHPEPTAEETPATDTTSSSAEEISAEANAIVPERTEPFALQHPPVPPPPPEPKRTAQRQRKRRSLAIPVLRHRRPGLRRPTRPPARPHPQAEHRHLRHPDRPHHQPVPRVHPPPQAGRRRRSRRVHLHGLAPHPHQVEDPPPARPLRRLRRRIRRPTPRTRRAPPRARAL